MAIGSRLGELYCANTSCARNKAPDRTASTIDNKRMRKKPFISVSAIVGHHTVMDGPGPNSLAVNSNEAATHLIYVDGRLYLLQHLQAAGAHIVVVIGGAYDVLEGTGQLGRKRQ